MDIIKNGLLDIEYDCIFNRLKAEATVTNLDNGKYLKVMAIFDTGASMTCIHSSLWDILCINSLYKIPNQGFHGEGIADVFHAQIDIYDKLSFIGNISIFDFKCDEVKLVIGMDIISKGDLILSNIDNKTHLTFLCPAQIDFEKSKLISKTKK